MVMLLSAGLVGMNAQTSSTSPADSTSGITQEEPTSVSSGAVHLQSAVAPLYPAEAKAAGIGGTVVLRAIIGKDGIIRDLTVVSGPDMFRDAALRAVKQWTYKPYKHWGHAVEVDTTIQVNFKPSKPKS